MAKKNLMKNIGIIGCRERNTKKDLFLVEDAFIECFEEGDRIISGGCPKGGDRFAELIAAKYKIPIKIFYADWKIGRHAGFLRNTDIANSSDILIACVAEDRIGGTEDTIKKFLKKHPKSKLIIV